MRAVVLYLLQDKDYRSIFVELFLLGLASGFVLPYVTLWVTAGLHGTTSQAAFIFVPSGIVAIGANMAAGAYSDRVRRRKEVILVTLVVGALCRLGLAFASSYPLALTLYAITGFSPFAIVFALLGDTVRRKADDGIASSVQHGAFIMNLERTAFSFGWLLGPVLGGTVVSQLGYAGMFLVSCGLYLSAFVWAWLRIADRTIGQGSPNVQLKGIGVREIVVLLLLWAFGLLLLAGDSGRTMFLALFLTERIGVSVPSVSWAFSVTVGAELLVMPIVGRMADRFGVVPILIAGVIAQVAYFVGLSISSHYWQVLALQLLYAFVISISSGIAMIFAQRSMPVERLALATSAYLVSRGLAPTLNSAFFDGRLVGMRLNVMFDVLGIFAAAALTLVPLILAVGSRGFSKRSAR